MDKLLISYSNIGPFMQPPVETNYDIVVQNSVTPSANGVCNLGQKDLRYLNVSTDLLMLTLLRNISHSAITDPLAFLEYNVAFLYIRTPFGIFHQSIVCHFDPIASWIFEPALLYLDTGISTIAMPKFMTERTIGIMSIPDLLACGYSIQRGHALDTIERRRDAVEQFTERQWHYLSLGPPDYHEYPPPSPPQSLPSTIPEFICLPFVAPVLVAYTDADDVAIQSAYAELSAASSGLLLFLAERSRRSPVRSFRFHKSHAGRGVHR